PHTLTHTLSFSLNPRPTRPTLFPYTTLFRSRHRGHYAVDGDEQRPGLAGEQARADLHQRCHRRRGVYGRAGGGHDHEGRREGGADRKSTRLNSSHRTTSYAVFCLKKKNYYTA